MVDSCLVGSDPVLMLTGPIAATNRLLANNQLLMSDIDVVEINEAFAAVVLAWERELKPDMATVNPNGGAIALGHPLGATGVSLIAKAAHEISETLKLKAICAWTSSGSTAFRIARERPNSTVIALTPNRATARRLTLVWGVHAIVTKDASDADDMAFRACKFALREGHSSVGERIIVVAGMPFGTPGATNMVRIAFVNQEHAAQA